MRGFADMSDLPVPSPDMVRAARAHLARRYARGVETLLWEEHHQPLADIDAIAQTILAIRAAQAAGQPPPDATDLGAALVVLQAARLDADRLEVELIQAVRGAGLDWTAVATVLRLPDADAAERRFERLRPRLDVLTDEVPQRSPQGQT
jgi:hypothetical protein